MTSYKVNILGNTPKEQWMNAIDLYLIVIGSNIKAVRNSLDGCSDETDAIACERLDSAMNVLQEFGNEMKRLVEGATPERSAHGEEKRA